MDIKGLDINLLLVFHKVYEVRNISRVAQSMDVKQSTVSNALARLRDRFDDPLFVRGGAGVQPTPVAETLAPQIEQALLLISDLGSTSSIFNPRETRRNFRILVADPLEPIILPKILQRIAINGDISIELVPPQASDLTKQLLDGVVELAVFLPPTRQASIEIAPACEFDLVGITRRGHPAMGVEPWLKVIRNYGFATLNLREGALSNSKKVQLWRRLLIRDVVLVHKISSIPPLVESSDLIGIVPRPFAAYCESKFDIDIHPLPSRIPRQELFFSWHHRNAKDPALLWMRDVIGEALKDMA